MTNQQVVAIMAAILYGHACHNDTIGPRTPEDAVERAIELFEATKSFASALAS